ncbi:MAG: ribosome small subunit-dependent GTPase A [Actinomycetota bacterium]|nr:ribosome small subunit-dependent GTPase A [Actinomycetota bacterium]
MKTHERWDEDDVRIRPGRTKSRPRTKERPAHAEAETGMVIAVDRGRFTVALSSDSNEIAMGRQIFAIKSRELGRKGIVVGDLVDLIGSDTSGTDDLARIVRRQERSSNLRRTADDVDPVERIIVANATQMAIVTSTADPEPSFGLIDRALVAAFDAEIQPILIITKTDLASADALNAMYGPLELPVFTVTSRVPPAELREALGNEVTVVLGHSGVGKSTLVNAIVPGSLRSTGHVNTVTGKGRHTSTSALALALVGGGWIIDTPGIRSFGLAHVDADQFIRAFPDLGPGIQDCPRACSHDEPDCGLNSWIELQPANVQERLLSLRRLLTAPTQLPAASPDAY